MSLTRYLVRSARTRQGRGELDENFIIAKHLVQKEDARLLRSLTYVFGFADSSDALFDQANGSGLKLIELLNTRAAAATTRDKALVSIMLSSIIATGVGGELSLASFTAFIKTYKAAVRNIAPNSRPSAGAEVEMVSLIAAKDEATRDLYEIKLEALIARGGAHVPDNLDKISALLTELLRARARSEEMDRITSGAKDPALVAAKKSPAPCGDCDVPEPVRASRSRRSAYVHIIL